LLDRKFNTLCELVDHMIKCPSCKGVRKIDLSMGPEYCIRLKSFTYENFILTINVLHSKIEEQSYPGWDENFKPQSSSTYKDVKFIIDSRNGFITREISYDGYNPVDFFFWLHTRCDICGCVSVAEDVNVNKYDEIKPIIILPNGNYFIDYQKYNVFGDKDLYCIEYFYGSEDMLVAKHANINRYLDLEEADDLIHSKIHFKLPRYEFDFSNRQQVVDTLETLITFR
jgi:hypothetical protein